MKTLRLIGMALMAILMCVNFASCSNEEVVPDKPAQDKYVSVGLQCVGEYLDIKDSPLSRASSEAVVIYVYTLNVKTGDDGSIIERENTPYASGRFASLDGLTINLLQDKKYYFRVAITVGGSAQDTEFSYSSKDPMMSENLIPITKEGFYGELDYFTPTEGLTATINTKRVSYGAQFIAQNLDEGILNINVSHQWNFLSPSNSYTIELTPDNPDSDKIYSFYKTIEAWRGIYAIIGNDTETGESIWGYKEYTSEKTIGINWTKENGEVIPLGTYKVTFKRNVRTTIRIDVANISSVSNGITVTKEETAITDDENEYEISGGEIVEVPVNSEP